MQQAIGRDFIEKVYSRARSGSNQIKMKCPFCQHTRSKNKSDRPMSIKIDGASLIYHCHHCNADGRVNSQERRNPMSNIKLVSPKPHLQLPNEICEESAAWLKGRKISKQTAMEMGCLLHKKNNKPVIGFAYATDKPDEYRGVKWRTANGTKEFWWQNSVNKLWGQQSHDESLDSMDDTIILAEGEMDALAIKEAFRGHLNVEVYSVPTGAPAASSNKKIDPDDDKKFSYVWEDRQKFDRAKKIILATDADKPGDALADELSRRVNKAKCCRVDWLGRKDANDLLIDAGREALRNQVINAEPVPLHGLNAIDHYSDEFQSLYDVGKPAGVSTGLRSLDKLFTLNPGSLTVVTGYPGEGKSALLNFLAVQVGQMYGWKTCFCSFEKPPSLHAVELAQILTKKHFWQNGSSRPRMTQEEKDYAQGWISDHILFQDYQDSEMPTIKDILEKASAAVMRSGVRVLVIDPFNFIHSDHRGLVTDMVSDMLTAVQLWCKQHSCLCFFVSHPVKPAPADRGAKQVPTGLDVAFSMAWWAKSDCGVSVVRSEGNLVEVHVWKARWSWQARLGKVELIFNTENGRYEEVQKIDDDDFDWEI